MNYLWISNGSMCEVLSPYRSLFNWHIFYQKKGKILNSAVEFDIMSTHTSWGNLSIVYYTLVGFRCFDEGRRSFFEHISASLPAFSIRETVHLSRFHPLHIPCDGFYFLWWNSFAKLIENLLSLWKWNY